VKGRRGGPAVCARADRCRAAGGVRACVAGRWSISHSAGHRHREGAARHLIADRLDITGARWSLAGAEAVLKLRALISNGDLDAYWRYHPEQEHQRSHTARYQPQYQPTA